MQVQIQNAEHYFETARERYRILLRRRAGKEAPWTNDRVFQEWRFCCVHREDDRTTQWFRENVRQKLDAQLLSFSSATKLVLSTITFRWFNRIETIERILDLILGTWDSEEAARRLDGVKPVVSGAYIIQGKHGYDKLNGVLWCVDQARELVPEYVEVMLDAKERHLESMWAMLQNVPFMGAFMAYEVVTDLRHTSFLNQAVDINTWANAGPGCARGLGWVKADKHNVFSRNSRDDQREMVDIMSYLLSLSKLEDFWPQEWPKWEMREVEHWACEYDKYRRAQSGESLKRRYR